VSALDCVRLVRQPVERTRCSLKDFCSHHLASFDGRGDHISIENWLNDMQESLLDVQMSKRWLILFISKWERPSAGGSTRRQCLSLSWVRRLPFLGMSLNMSSIGTSFPESCKR
jgi:hypothetical protein